jgi:hypothetical protein
MRHYGHEPEDLYEKEEYKNMYIFLQRLFTGGQYFLK